MRYTVKQLADLAGISTRTLRYYDQIGLLQPSAHGDNGYRYYDESAALRLQQIMFYRELDLSLDAIRAVLDDPNFDLMQALATHREALRHEAERLGSLIHTIDKTMSHLKGEMEMTTQELFAGFDEEKQRHYEEAAAQQWGSERVNESRRRWGSYSAEKKAQIMAEGGEIYRELAGYIGQDPALEAVQRLVARWRQNIRYFYEPTPEILLGLAQAYAEQPDFAAFYQKIHPDLPQFLRQAIEHYCHTLPAQA